MFKNYRDYLKYALYLFLIFIFLYLVNFYINYKIEESLKLNENNFGNNEYNEIKNNIKLNYSLDSEYIPEYKIVNYSRNNLLYLNRNPLFNKVKIKIKYINNSMICKTGYYDVIIGINKLDFSEFCNLGNGEYIIMIIPENKSIKSLTYINATFS